MHRHLKNLSLIVGSFFVLANAVIAGAQTSSFSEADLFPFDGRHLHYPTFQADLEQISNELVNLRCAADPGAVSDRLREAYTEGCAFPKLLERLHDETATANAAFAGGDLETREQAQFIDMEYGWVIRSALSLDNTSHRSLLHLILIKHAVQMATEELADLWMLTDQPGSAQGRMYTIPKFSAGMERDVILARTMSYTLAMHCFVSDTQMEEACVQNRLALALPLNVILKEFQQKPYSPEDEIRPWYQASSDFRAQLAAWLAQHNSASAILQALQQEPDDLKKLELAYGALVDLPKRVHSADINVMAARADIHRYVDELKPINPVYTDYLAKHEPELSPELISIFAQIRKQLSIYYQ